MRLIYNEVRLFEFCNITLRLKYCIEEYKELMIGESSTRQSSTAEDVSVTDTIDEKIKKEI